MVKVYKNLNVEKDQNTSWVTLNRPHRLNAIDDVLIEELDDVLDVLEKDVDVRCVIITGEGDKAFSTGADLTIFSKMTPAKAEEFSRKGQKVFGKIEEMSKPVIAAINGLALGGGLELAIACDIRLIAEHGEMGSPEITLGLIPAWGGTQRLVRLVGLAKAKEIVMLGARLKADEALKMSLVNKVVRSSMLRKEVRMLASNLCDMSPIALKYVKHALNFGTQAPMETGLRLETSLLGLILSTDDFKKGVDTFLLRRKAELKGI